MRLSRLYLWLMAVSVLGGLALIGNFFAGLAFVPGDELPMVCAMILLFYSVAGLGCAAAYENGHAPRLMRSGMIIGAIAVLTWFAIIVFQVLQADFNSMRVVMWPTLWTCLMMLVGVVLLLPMRSGWRWWIRAATIGLLAALALFIACAFTFYPDPMQATTENWEIGWERRRRYEDFSFRVGGALMMLAGGSLALTLVAGISTALMGGSNPKPALGRPYWLKCPRCGCEQDARTGEHLCVSCGLRARVELT